MRFSIGDVFCCNLAERLPFHEDFLSFRFVAASAVEKGMSCQSAMKWTNIVAIQTEYEPSK